MTCCSVGAVGWFRQRTNPVHDAAVVLLSVLGRDPVCHSQRFSFFSEDIFQLELLMALVMLQWIDHRAPIDRCAPWQLCWLWEHSLHIYLKCCEELCHKSAASVCIDLPYRSFDSGSLCCNFEGVIWAVCILSWESTPLSTSVNET